MPGNATEIKVGVQPNPVDDIGPAWICLEYYAAPYSYIFDSLFMAHNGVRFAPVIATSWSKDVIAYWRGDVIYEFVLTY